MAGKERKGTEASTLEGHGYDWGEPAVSYK